MSAEDQFFLEAGLTEEEKEEAIEAELRRLRAKNGKNENKGKNSKGGEKDETKDKKEKRRRKNWLDDSFDKESDSSMSDDNAPDSIPTPVKRSGDDIRKMKLARETVREARPKDESEKMGIDDPKDFVSFKFKFMNLTNIDGLTDEDKLKELTYWTKGAAKTMIESNLGTTNPTKALASAWSQMSMMFKSVIKSPLERLETTFKKGQLMEASIASHYDTLADLRAVYNDARRSKTYKDFNRLDIIRTTVNKKIVTYRSKFWEQQAETKREDASHKTKFVDIITFLAEKAETASLMGTLTELQTKGRSTNVNLTETDQSWSGAVKDNPPQTQTQQQPRNDQQRRPGCAMKCKHSHRTKDCRKLINHPDPDKMDQIARELEICYNCGDPGHTARNCKDPKPDCGICKNGNTHLTIFHHFLARRNKRNQDRAKARGQGQTGAAPGQNNTSTDQRQQGRPDVTKTTAAAATLATKPDTTQTKPTTQIGNEPVAVIDQSSQ